MKTIQVFGILLVTLTMLNCGKPPDQKAYEEVITTMSLSKAKDFFSKYPQSKYADKLVKDITGWCDQEGTKGCYEMVLETIPKDHPKRSELADFYKKRFNMSEKNNQSNGKDER